MNKYYVYAHYIDEEVEPFYIGKGCGGRAFELCNRSAMWNKCKDGKDITIKKFAENLTNSQALLLEEDLIEKYKPKANLVRTGVVKELGFEHVNSILYYDPTSPTFLRWKIDCGWTGNYFSCKQDDVAGCITKYTNRVFITINKKIYFGHRIVWILNNKNICTSSVIDHIDGNSSNNLITNLIEVSSSVNSRNRKQNSRNTSNITGVYLKNMKGDPYWTATWQDLLGNNHRKYFSVNKYSNDGAKELAIAAREQAISLLNKQGAGYTDRHCGEN